MDIERILGTDSGKVAFEKTDRNMIKARDEINKVLKYGEGTEKTAEHYATWENVGSGFARINSNQQNSPSIYHQAVLGSYFDENHGIYLSMDTRGVLYASADKKNWKEVATTETEDITLLNGFIQETYHQRSCVSITGNVVTLSISMCYPNYSAITANTYNVCNIPSKYIPQETIYGFGVGLTAPVLNDNTEPILIQVLKDGRVNVTTTRNDRQIFSITLSWVKRG
ncbi:MAG: hypothetical protein ACRCX8_01370 [Sarcina sp.]